MRRLLTVSLIFFIAAFAPPAGAAPDKAARAAAERLMTTIGLEKRVDTIVQLYLNFLPAQTPEQQAKAASLRERAPGAGQRFQEAVVNAAVRQYSKPELDALDTYFASGEGQRLLTTAITRAVLSLGQKGQVKAGDILRPDDLPKDNPALMSAAAKYPAFETAAKQELQREFAQEIALITAR
ncbi:MAG TPA: hypothetical protein VF194_00835 [Ferrovibrio sp.]|uniref:hypothetical protein n=1 Tax=Ferrovibrio sp. TaxID=1917215 RepID=UPI002ED45C3D